MCACFFSFFDSTEKNLLEHKDKIPEEVKADVQKAIDELKAVMESEDAEAIKEKVQALQVRFSDFQAQVSLYTLPTFNLYVYLVMFVSVWSP